MSVAPDETTGDEPSDVAGDGALTPAEPTEAADGGGTAGRDDTPTDRERAIRAEAERDAMQRLIDRYGLAGGDGDPPAQPGPQAAEDATQDLEEVQQLIAEQRVLAKRGDTSAKLLLFVLRQREADLTRFANVIRMQQEQISEAGLPDDRREAFKEFLAENGDAFKSKAHARRVFMKMHADAARPPADTTPTTTQTRRPAPRPVVDTTPRAVPAREARAREMTDQQWQEAMSTLPTAERLDLQRRAEAGEIVFKD